VNRLHGWLCRSARWRETIAHRVPWVLSGTEFGHHVLELGPGPGLTTDLLRRELPRLTALEIDPVAADALRVRMGDGNVEVVTGDGAAVGFDTVTIEKRPDVFRFQARKRSTPNTRR
jgi:16S rRNA A1518/A1519 N6-dimethyltransferase RsmA/KsgA/DIM1 with predicted DNA glycosylase/AP lyase activity